MCQRVDVVGLAFFPEKSGNSFFVTGYRLFLPPFSSAACEEHWWFTTVTSRITDASHLLFISLTQRSGEVHVGGHEVLPSQRMFAHY